MTKQPLKAVHTRINEDVTLRLVVMVALAKQSVQVVPQKPEPLVFYAAIHRVVVAGPGGKAAFPVAHQGIGCQESHPFLKIDDLADLGNETVISNVIVVEFIDKAEQIRPVVFRHVCFFNVVVSVIVGIRSLAGAFFVVKVGDGPGVRSVFVVSAAIDVAGIVVRKMIFGPVAVKHLYSGIRTVRPAVVAFGEILPVYPELDDAYVRRGQARHLEDYAAH